MVLLDEESFVKGLDVSVGFLCHKFLESVVVDDGQLVIPDFDLKRLHREPHQHHYRSRRLFVVLFALKLGVVIVEGFIHCS